MNGEKGEKGKCREDRESVIGHKTDFKRLAFDFGMNVENHNH